MIGRKGDPSAQGTEKPLGFDDFDLRLGDLMRGERATLGKSLLDVQRELKIKATYIAAIENCDVAAFETPGFIAGYVRSYARFLGMDPEWAYGRFCDEAGFRNVHGLSAGASAQRGTAAQKRRTKTYSDPLANPDALFVPKGESVFEGIQPGAVGSLLVLVALIGGLGYGGWSVLQEVQRVRVAPVDQAPVVAADLDPLASVARLDERESDAAENGEDVAAAESGDAGNGAQDPTFDRIYRPQALETPVMVARDGPIASIDPGVAAAGRRRAPDPLDAAARAARDAVAALAQQQASEDSATPVKVVEDAPPTVEILAVRPAWVRVRAADGTVLLEKTLDAGERYTVPQTEAPATLRAGNSGSVYFAVNGETYGPAAPGAQVVSNLALSAQALSGSFSVADLGADPELARIVAVAEAGSDAGGE